jgi:hypothetical protein
MTKSTKHEDYQYAVFLIVLSLPPSHDQRPSSAPHSLTTSGYVLLLMLQTKFQTIQNNRQHISARFNLDGFTQQTGRQKILDRLQIDGATGGT